MSNYPQDLKYCDSHEYVKVDGNIATIGITSYAVEQLGDVVYVELPKVGTEYEKGKTFGVVESVKAVSDLYTPLSGKVVEVNNLLNDTPEAIADDPYGEAWVMKLELSNNEELNSLMDSSAYESFVGSL